MRLEIYPNLRVISMLKRFISVGVALGALPGPSKVPQT